MTATPNIQKVRQMLNTIEGNMTVKLVRIGKSSPNLSPVEKAKAQKVEGCAVATWLYLEAHKDTVIIRPDSESMIVKGVMILMAEAFQGVSKREIIANPPLFLAELGIHQHLSPNRRNGIGKVWKIIEDFCQLDLEGSLDHKVSD